MAAIPVKIRDHRTVAAGRQIPGKEKEAVGGSQSHLLDAERRELAELGAASDREIEQMALEEIEGADQRDVGGPLASAQLDARRFELTASGQNVTAARRPHRRRIAGCKDDVRNQRYCGLR